MDKEIKKHNFRGGDVVKNKKRGGLYVVARTKSWVHKGNWISLVKEMGVISLLDKADEYKLVKRREDVGKKWWLIFPKGEK